MLNKIFLWLMLASLLSVSNIYANATSVFSKASKSIYSVISPTLEGDKVVIKKRGSGVALAKNILATNCHISGKNKLIAVFYQNNFVFSKRLFYRSDVYDLCIYLFENVLFNPISLRLTSNVQVGEQVYAIGNPHGMSKTISQGIVSRKQNLKGITYLYSDAQINPGSSGGGLFDGNGMLIGITTFKIRGDSGGFSIPSELLLMTGVHLANKFIPQTTMQKTDRMQVKQFGDSRLLFLKHDDHCLILIPGINKRMQHVGYSVYNPKYPNKLFFFPKAEKFLLFSKTIDIGAYTNPSNQTTRTILFFRDAEHDLLYVNQHVKYKNYYYSPDIKAVRETLINGAYFIVHFDVSKNYSQYNAVNYGLWGFSEAINALEQDCGMREY